MHGPAAQRILVTGATGYIGARLVPQLLAAGHDVRVMARDPERLRSQPWAGSVDIVTADVLDAVSLGRALDGMDVAYYLVHAIGAGGSFEDIDRQAAHTFADGARASGVQRSVFLGGLTPAGEQLSPHLRSRAEVGEILLASGVPTVVLRAAVILGSGSASFEMLRYLTERLPVMVTPRWVQTRIQPIAIQDVLHYLVAAAALPPEVNRGFDIGGPEILTYVEMMRRYASVAGLRPRVILPVPVLTPSLSSHWVNVVTPVPRALARPLVESLRNTVVCEEHDIAEYVADPSGGLLGFDRAVAIALAAGDGTPGAAGDSLPSDPSWAGGTRYADERRLTVRATPARLWFAVDSVARSLRGWRVEEMQDQRHLRLRAERRLPGSAWLDLTVEQEPDGRTCYRQRAVFEPKGLPGLVSWRVGWPIREVNLRRLRRRVARAVQTQG